MLQVRPSRAQGLATADRVVTLEEGQDFSKHHALPAWPRKPSETRCVDREFSQARPQKLSGVLFRGAADFTDFAVVAVHRGVVGDVPLFPAALEHPPVASHRWGPWQVI